MINGHDRSQRSRSPGKAGAPRDRAGVADRRQGWFVSYFEGYSSSGATITYRKKYPQNAG